MYQSSKGQEILRQHRYLLDLLEEIEAKACFECSTASSHAEAATLLTHLLDELAEHFRVEEEGLCDDYSDNSTLRAALEELNAEHPILLRSFREALEAMESEEASAKVADLLRSAIERFRDHESREDRIFSSE